MKNLFYLLVLFSTNLFSQNWEVHIPLFSYHPGLTSYVTTEINDKCTGGFCFETYKINNFNPGLILYKKYNKFKIGAGLYRNSEKKLSITLGGGYNFTKNFGIEGGIATNYLSGTIPVAMLYYRYKHIKLTFNHSVINLGLSF